MDRWRAGRARNLRRFLNLSLPKYLRVVERHISRKLTHTYAENAATAARVLEAINPRPGPDIIGRKKRHKPPAENQGPALLQYPARCILHPAGSEETLQPARHSRLPPAGAEPVFLTARVTRITRAPSSGSMRSPWAPPTASQKTVRPVWRPRDWRDGSSRRGAGCRGSLLLNEPHARIPWCWTRSALSRRDGWRTTHRPAEARFICRVGGRR